MEPLVSAAWLEAELGASDLVVLDCRVSHAVAADGSNAFGPGRAEWEAAHIPLSSHVDILGELSDGANPVPLMLPPAADFAAVMTRLGVGDGRRVVVYDSLMNMWAARVWWMLRAYGFDTAAVLDGGWVNWTAERRPVTTETGAAAAAHAPFVPRPRPDLMAGRDEVLAALDRADVRIVSALERDVHRGDQPVYGRAGHIPGAGNVPFVELVDPRTHRYLPEGNLRDAFAATVADQPERVITYCGGGIAAASDAFVLSLLGLPDVAVYDGSLLEWAADPALPLVVGDEG